MNENRSKETVDRRRRTADCRQQQAASDNQHGIFGVAAYSAAVCNLLSVQRSVRYGITLVEVVTAMLLLGTLLVTLLVGFSRQAVQLEQSSQRLRVMEAAEKQLAEWHLRFGFAPVNEEGEWTINNTVYCWQTRPVEQQIDRQFLLGKIALDVFSADRKTPILSLELVVPSWETLE